MTGAGQRRRRTDERRPAGGFLELGQGVSENRPLDFGERSWVDVERAYVLHLMKVHSWNISRAAQAAQIKRSTFASRMRRLGVKKRR
jgi:transcriptional regulator of acetoin/glycerol metabolism